MPIVAHIGGLLGSADVEGTLGLDGRTRQGSTAGRELGIVGCDDHMLLTGELGRRVGWRTTSTTRGGGGNKGFINPMRQFLTSSLLPHSSSPAPSSSRPSKALTWVR